MANTGRVTIVSVDYSMSCPAVIVLPPGETTFQNCSAYFLTERESVVGKFKNIRGKNHKPWKTQEQRYDQIAEWAMNIIIPTENPFVFLEGYSMGSKGKVFNIAENTAILKHKLYKNKIPLEIVPPTTVKQFFHGKGNADKAAMVAVFLDKTGLDLKKLFLPEHKLDSPCTDIADAWAIACYGIDFLKKGD